MLKVSNSLRGKTVAEYCVCEPQQSALACIPLWGSERLGYAGVSSFPLALLWHDWLTRERSILPYSSAILLQKYQHEGSAPAERKFHVTVLITGVGPTLTMFQNVA